MAEFKHVANMVQAAFENMYANETVLFKADVDPDILWSKYLESFPEGSNEIFRKKRESDCSCCRNFIRKYGGVVSIDKQGLIHTLWDFDAPDQFRSPIKAMQNYVLGAPVTDVFFFESSMAGTAVNTEVFPPNDNAHRDYWVWNHFALKGVPSRFVKKPESIPGIVGSLRSDIDVFVRSMSEISMDAVNTVLELIENKLLYRGSESRLVVSEFKEVMELSRTKYPYWIRRMGALLPTAVSHIRNTSIGTLLVDLSSGMDVDQAVTRYEQIVAPSNYKRPKAIFTSKMVADAKAKIEELGLVDALPRRFAQISDISARDVLFLDRDVAASVKDPFAILNDRVVRKGMDFSNSQWVSIDDFLKDWVPNVSKVELFVGGGLRKNHVALIAPKNPNAPSMFSWGNNFSWAYRGNMADSDISRNVSKAGGSLDGILRFSIQWNDTESTKNESDYDAHCVTPFGHIAFHNKHVKNGALDVDIIHPSLNPLIPAVENIVFPGFGLDDSGIYKFAVHCYRSGQGNCGFKYELECNGEIRTGEINRPIQYNETVRCFDIKVANGIPEILTDYHDSVTSGGFKTVSAIMLSPNYWEAARDDNSHIHGNKHYFFMMNDLPFEETPNGFFNEYLRPELRDHRRVFEALGETMKVDPDPKKLVGLGFSSTLHREIVARVTGDRAHVIKIQI